jgi:hypothetical protein
MGYGTYSTSTYAATTGAKISSGTTFGYDRTARSTGRFAAHESLDPTKKNVDGKLIRESRDGVDHPNAVPIVVGFDSTGSMARTPRIVQEKLANLFGLLLRKGYVEDPQVMISTYGDAYCDRVPLQVSQFESDNRIDDNLDNLLLEGGGGGNGGETASLLWYYLNKHVETDAWDKRGKKGYLFVIADEVALDLEPRHITQFIGEEEAPARDQLTVKKLAADLQEKWEVFVLLIDNSSAMMQGSQKFYTDLFGAKNVIILENDETVSETIGAVIGRLENDDLDDDELIDDLVSEGSTKAVAQKTVTAIAKLGGAPKGSVAKANLNIDTTDSGVQFL